MHDTTATWDDVDVSTLRPRSRNNTSIDEISKTWVAIEVCLWTVRDTNVAKNYPNVLFALTYPVPRHEKMFSSLSGFVGSAGRILNDVPKKSRTSRRNWTLWKDLYRYQQWMIKKITYVRSVGSPIRQRPISSLPRTIIKRTKIWCWRSTQPPLRISASRLREAASATSSGTPPGIDTASEQCNTPVVDSATSDRAYPGDLREERYYWVIRNKGWYNLLPAIFTFVHIGY